MASKLLNKILSIKAVCQEEVFALLDIRPYFKYIDGQRTENIEGHIYDVANTDTYDKYAIKIPGKKPLMKPETLQEARENGEKFFVEFQNATIKAYFNFKTNTVEDILNAEDVHIVETE